MGYLFLSDIHPGRFGPGREENEAALQAFSRYAVEHGHELIVDGDLDEELLLRQHWVRPKAHREECAITGRAFALYSKELGPIDVIRGNHDHPQLDERLLDRRFSHSITSPLQFRVRKDLVNVMHSDIASTHGHLLHGIRASRELIDACLRGEIEPERLLSQLNNPVLESLYTKMEWWHDVALHVVMRAAQIVRKDSEVEGLALAVRSWWKDREQHQHDRLGLDERHLEWTARKARMTDGAGRMGVALGTPVVVVGHDHQYGISRRSVRDREGAIKQVLVANPGHFVDKWHPKTAIVVDTRQKMVLCLCWDQGGIRVLQKESYEEAMAA